MNAIEVDHVTKAFGRFKAVDDLSLTVSGGMIFGLLGPNGAGKTTTIRMIMDITAPDTGAIRVLGRPAARESLARVGYLPEERGLYRRMRVLDHLLFLAAIKEVDAATAKKRIERWLDAMELRPWLHRRVDELSKGMQQKIQFIATIVHDPEILILDEPFSGLDPINVNLIRSFLLEFRAEGKTIVFSTHVLEQAEKLCDHICLITKSKKVLDGDLKDLRRRYAGNVIRLSTDASLERVRSLPGVAGAAAVDGGFHVTLADATEARTVVQKLFETNRVDAFSQKEPELEEIYLKAVQDAGLAETRVI
ncbi:MAG TPA: ATP-binding cassette domain-containing protein [Thermoanaerobaculia bacterium]|nr:ATP-binding cassette domain-containing protein [Thermoanaerobaculia bacterium]